MTTSYSLDQCVRDLRAITARRKLIRSGSLAGLLGHRHKMPATVVPVPLSLLARADEVLE